MSPSTTTMTTTPTTEPAKPTERSGGGWVILGTLVCLMVGVAGLLTVTMGCGVEDSSLRGSSTTSVCPAQVPFLNAQGILEELDLASSQSYQPSCASAADPQDGTYVDFMAPTDGQVTLAAWSVWVDPVTCACAKGVTATQSVTAGEKVRLWVPRNTDTQPMHFVSDNNCPTENVPILDDSGRVDTQEDNFVTTTTTTHNAPSCVSPTDPQVGRYYDWIAPAEGVVTLAAWTVLLEDATTCACANAAVAQQTVTTGQRVRVWTSALEEDQPLQFLGKINP
mmetsp:Transcript_15459/g.29513  ORF Transcript_15459/g.29513 Transcript_15459/m.29513 type:complete len:280 (-) Transcript_15459:31-870(-)|eukprot:scaffold7808_cov184-Amphora_coffeaeformis.AAC.7